MDARITIDGTPYVLPRYDTLDLDEAIIMYDYSGLTYDQLFLTEGLNPKVVKGLLHVAIQRSDPALSYFEIREMTNLNMMDLMDQLTKIAEAAVDPTQGGQPPVASDSKPSSEESTNSSGADGGNDSEHSPEKSNPASTGSPTSGTVVASDQATLVP